MYSRGVGGACVRCFAWIIFDGSCVLENADVFTFLRSPLNLLSYGDEWRDGLNGATQEKPTRIGITGLSLWGKGFVFWMEKMTPDNARKSLRREDLSIVFASRFTTSPV